MKARKWMLLSLIAAALAIGGPLAAQTQSSTSQIKTRLKNFAVQTNAEYLGALEGKTVVRFRLSSEEIAKALLGKKVRQYSMTLKGSIRNAAGAVVEPLSYPFSGDLREGQPISFSFLRALSPAHYVVEIDLGDAAKTYATLKFPIDVPEVGRAFSPEMAFPQHFSACGRKAINVPFAA